MTTPIKPTPIRIRAAFFLILAASLIRPDSARADCPGCGLAILVVPAELLVVDGISTLAVFGGGRVLGIEGRMAPTFVAGLWGGAAGFILGSIASSAYYRETWTAMGIGGALVGLPIGTFIGTLYGFAKDAGTAKYDEAGEKSSHPFHLVFFPLEKGAAVSMAVRLDGQKRNYSRPRATRGF